MKWDLSETLPSPSLEDVGVENVRHRRSLPSPERLLAQASGPFGTPQGGTYQRTISEGTVVKRMTLPCLIKSSGGWSRNYRSLFLGEIEGGNHERAQHYVVS